MLRMVRIVCQMSRGKLHHPEQIQYKGQDYDWSHSRLYGKIDF